MSSFPRAELEEMMRRFVAANDTAGETGDWSLMPAFYTEDALYTWNNGPRTEFVARGRKQLADWAFGTEMAGLETWTYPYVKVLIDDAQGEVIGFWRQLADERRADGSVYEIAGTGGSWFRYAGNYQWSWQRDFFDHANAGAIFMEMQKNGQLNETMQERVRAGSKMPGWVRRTGFDWYETIEPR